MGRQAPDWDGFDMEAQRQVIEVMGLQTVFINGVCAIDLIGSEGTTLRLTYYVDGKTRLNGQPTEKVQVLEVIIPLADYLLARGEVAARLNALGVKAISLKDGCNG